ncbi:Ig-like domain-containing protein [Streptomyces tritici]|uniref:Ig-like domain-containing protein n=1 Tax=Streptomyces tritici TaxID=2054410 RepID=UPI003AEF2A98
MSKICIIGNSVAASRTAKEAPLAGWGQYLGEFMTAYHEVRNYARDAMTLRGYFNDRFATLLNMLDPGDVVLINFGGVEQRIDNPQRYHGPREFQEFLRVYIERIRGEGAVPVLVTPAARCAFEADGSVSHTRDEYPQWMREVAAETESPLVDMNAFTMQLLHDLGPQRARRYFRWTDAGEHPNHPEGMIDSSHFNEVGAREVARMVAISLYNSPLLPRGIVEPERVQVGAEFPPPLEEFTVEKPEFALYSEVRAGAAPVIASPGPHRVVGAMHKFSGTAEPGTSYMLFFENGGYIGGTRVNAEGKWTWRRVLNWTEGEHELQAVGHTPQGVSPVAAVRFTVKTFVLPPVVAGPKEGAWTGPRPRFSGSAEKGVKKVSVLEGGRLIGQAPVQEDGTWKFTHPHDWKHGTYQLQFVSIFSAIHSAPATLTIRVHGLPEENWLRQSALAARHECAEKCEHLPFAGRW